MNGIGVKFLRLLLVLVRMILLFFFRVDKCDDEIVAVIEGALNLLTRCR